jgi:hypothetical protein
MRGGLWCITNFATIVTLLLLRPSAPTLYPREGPAAPLSLRWWFYHAGVGAGQLGSSSSSVCAGQRPHLLALATAPRWPPPAGSAAACHSHFLGMLHAVNLLIDFGAEYVVQQGMRNPTSELRNGCAVCQTRLRRADSSICQNKLENSVRGSAVHYYGVNLIRGLLMSARSTHTM